MYDTFWIGGMNDGKCLGSFSNLNDAIKFAKEFEKQHKDEFNPIWGGVGISDSETLKPVNVDW